jgi:hypothetical protein
MRGRIRRSDRVGEVGVLIGMPVAFRSRRTRGKDAELEAYQGWCRGGGRIVIRLER